MLRSMYVHISCLLLRAVQVTKQHRARNERMNDKRDLTDNRLAMMCSFLVSQTLPDDFRHSKQKRLSLCLFFCAMLIEAHIDTPSIDNARAAEGQWKRSKPASKLLGPRAPAGTKHVIRFGEVGSGARRATRRRTEMRPRREVVPSQQSFRAWESNRIVWLHRFASAGASSVLCEPAGLHVCHHETTEISFSPKSTRKPGHMWPAIRHRHRIRHPSFNATARARTVTMTH